jgi:hypothetical protein
MKCNLSEPIWYSKSSPKRNVYSHECIYYKHRQISTKQPNATSQTPRKQEQGKSKPSRREIMKLMAEINEIETKKKKIQRPMKQKSCSFKK